MIKSSFACRRALATTGTVALLAGALVLQSGGLVMAQTATDTRIRSLEDQVKQLQRSIDELKASQVIPPRPPVTALPPQGQPPGVHFNVGGQDFQVYGRAHVSASMVCNGASIRLSDQAANRGSRAQARP